MNEKKTVPYDPNPRGAPVPTRWAQVTLPTGATVAVGRHAHPDGHYTFSHIMENDQEDGKRTRLEFSLTYEAAFALARLYAAFGVPVDTDTLTR